jgi:sulfur carrier protein ThiS
VKVNIKILSGGVKEETREVTSGTKYEDILSSLQINPEIVIVFSNGTPVPLDDIVAAGDIKILRVVTGG